MMALTPLHQKLAWWPPGFNPLLFEDAEKVVRTSDHFNDVEAVCKFFLDPSIAETILGGRQKHWLNAFLKGLCRDKGIPVPRCDSLESKAREIVDIVRGPSPSGEGWNGFWVPLALTPVTTVTTLDITPIAARFDAGPHSALLKIPFSHLTSWLSGFRNRFISNFFDNMFNLSSILAQKVSENNDFKDALVLLLQKLEHPLSRWIVSTAMNFDASSSPNPSDALQFLFDPIREQFQQQSSSVLPITQRLLILEARFNLRMENTNGRSLDDTPLSTDFTLWENVQKGRPEELARSITQSVRRLFSLLSHGERSMEDVLEDQSNLSNDVWACLNVHRSHGNYFMKLAEHLIEFHNMLTARAIGKGLCKFGFQCSRNWSDVWNLIDPGNHTKCREYMDKHDCLPWFSPYMADLPKNLAKISLKHLGEWEVEQNVGREKQAVGEGVEQDFGGREQAVREGVEQNIGWREKAQNIGWGAVLVNRNSSSHTKHAVGDSDDHNYSNLPPSEGAPSGMDTNPQHGNHEFISVVLTADGRAKPNEAVVSKDTAKDPWWKNESAKAPVRKPIVASTSRKDAVDSSTLGPLPEVPSKPAPSPLAGADPSISSLRGCEINQERSQHWKLDERVATTHDGHLPRPEIQRGSTMRTDRNHLQAFSLAVNPIKVAGANAREAPPRGSRRPKRKREVSKPDSEQNSREANSWSSKSGNIEVQVNDYATKEPAQKRARSAPRSLPPVRDKGVRSVAHEHCPMMKGGSIAPTDRNGSMPTLAKLALDMMRDCNQKSEERNSIVGSDCATAPPSVTPERAESWPIQALGSEERPVRAKNGGNYPRIAISSLLNEKTTPSRTAPSHEPDLPGSAFHNESDLQSSTEIHSQECSPVIQRVSIARADNGGPSGSMGAEVRKESKAIPTRCPGQQEPSTHSPAVATSHTETDAQQTTPQDEWGGSSEPASSAEHNINENIPIATSPGDGDGQVDFDITNIENLASLESPSISELANPLEDRDSGFELESGTDDDSLPPSICDYHTENGRTYHKFKKGRYLLPNDEEEKDRLDLQHCLFRETHDQKLLLCPVDLSGVHRVLDLGTGTGIWALDFADENSNAEVLGIDLSPTQPVFIAPNVRFIIDDIEDTWPYKRKFDVIHGQMLNKSIRDWPRLFKQSFDNLAPGGYIEFVDVSPVLKVEDGSPREPSALKEWAQALIQCYEQLGMNIDCESHRRRLEQSGFEDIVEVRESWPLNCWPAKLQDKLLGRGSQENALMGLSGFSLAPFTRVKHWSRNKIDTLLAEVRNEITDMNIHASWPIYVVYARKPMGKIGE